MALGIQQFAQGAMQGAGNYVKGNTGSGFWQGAGGQATAQGASGILGGAMGMMTRNWYDKRQYRQQKKLTALGLRSGKEMADYEQQLAKEMFEATGYGAQRRQMEQAGLNVGLMYGMGGGAGGSTQGRGDADAVNTGYAPTGGGEIGLGMQIGLQNLATASTIKLQDALAKKATVEATKTGGVDTELTGAQIETEKIKQVGMNFANRMAEVNTRIAEGTEQIQVQTITADMWKAIEEANTAKENAIKAGVDRKIAEQTAESEIEKIKQEAIGVGINNALMRSGIAKNKQEIENMKKGVDLINNQISDMIAKRGIEWAKIDQKEQERFLEKAFLEVQKQQVEFQTSTPAQLKQWVDLLGGFLNAVPTPTRKIGF